MKGVILVGGEGTRMRPLTCNTAKTMLPVLNRPFLEHMIGHLRRHGIDDIVLSLGYLPGSIEGHFGDGGQFGVKLTYVVEESPLGTAGGVKNAERHLDGPFFVFNGDIFSDIDLSSMLSAHLDRKARASIALTPVEDPSAYGVVETDARGRVKRFVEKPPREEATTNMINAGIYVLDREVLAEVPPNTRYMFEHHLFPRLLEKGVPVFGYPSDCYWMDMGTPQKYLQLHHDLLEGKSISFSYNEGMRCGAESLVHPSARIEGPVMMGSRCQVGPGVRIEGPAVIGADCQVLDGARIEGAVLWQNVRIGQGAQLDGCIVGDGSLIGDNCRIPQGAVLADNVAVAADRKLEPGEAIWPGTRVE